MVCNGMYGMVCNGMYGMVCNGMYGRYVMVCMVGM